MQNNKIHKIEKEEPINTKKLLTLGNFDMEEKPMDLVQ